MVTGLGRIGVGMKATDKMFIHKHFSAREFHCRSGGAVRYFRLSTESQVAAVGVAAIKSALSPKTMTPKPAVSATSSFLVAGVEPNVRKQTSARKLGAIFDTLTDSFRLAIGAGTATVDFSIAGIKARNRTLMREWISIWSRGASLRAGQAGIDRMRNGGRIADAA